MSFCGMCGKQIEDNGAFCPYCGNKQNNNSSVKYFNLANNTFLITVNDEEIIFDRKVFSKHLIKNVPIKDIFGFFIKDSRKTLGVQKLTIVTYNNVITQDIDCWKNDDNTFSAFTNCLKEIISNKPAEIRKKCKVCGKVFCYNASDILRNNSNLNSAGLASLGATVSLFVGTSHDTYELLKRSDRAVDKVINYNKCPNCGSIDLVDCSEDVIQNNDSNNSLNAVDEIKKFKELFDMGAITQEEYDKKKKELLK